MKFIADHDYHIHSHLSLCSSDKQQTAKNILEYSKNNGFKEICITDHFWDENIPGASGFDFYAQQDFKHISALLPLPQDNDIKFHFGCETEIDKNMVLGISNEVIEKFDFVIIPTTHLHMLGFTIDKKDTSIERRAYLYAERLRRLLDMDLPFHKIGIAHLTCPLIDADYPKAHIEVLEQISDETFRELFSKASEAGAGIELNFPIEIYNEEELPKILRPYETAKKCGCKFYLGSDAHHPNKLKNAKLHFERIINALNLTENDKFSLNSFYG